MREHKGAGGVRGGGGCLRKPEKSGSHTKEGAEGAAACGGRGVPGPQVPRKIMCAVACFTELVSAVVFLVERRERTEKFRLLNQPTSPKIFQFILICLKLSKIKKKKKKLA